MKFGGGNSFLPSAPLFRRLLCSSSSAALASPSWDWNLSDTGILAGELGFDGNRRLSSLSPPRMHVSSNKPADWVDLQSYLSDLSLFLAYESKRLYILVDNRPWLKNLSSRSARIWQLMVTKSRLSPFAKTKSRRKKKVEKQGSIKSDATQKKLFKKCFSLIDAANLSHKRVMLPVKNLRNKFLLNSELHGVLHGFIVFEVEWTHVRGINYLNQLQTDTSFALEAKFMKRWEFDSIDQAAGCISSWFFGTDAELQILKDHLCNNSVEERFFDAKEELSGSDSPDAYGDAYHGDQSGEDCPTSRLNQDLDAPPSCGNSVISSSPPGVKRGKVTSSRNTNVEVDYSSDEKQCQNGDSADDHDTCSTSDSESTPLSCGNSVISSSPPGCKRGKVTSSRNTNVEVDYSSDEKQCQNGDSADDHDTCSTSDSESSIDSFIYKDVLIVFRFNDHVLPFRLRDILVSDLRLLTLLEAGLPSWVIFLQSYPGFCHVYRPWMCLLARALYVTISIITVLIGFYDLYKNVPVLKATAAHLCGPLLYWIDTWEMATRIKYLGTMLFLHNSKKAVKWFLTVIRITRSFFSVLTQPLVEPLTGSFDFLLPLWNVCSSVVVTLCSVAAALIGSLWNLVEDLGEMLLQPFWILLSSVWTIGTSVLFPLFQFLWEIIYRPIRLIVLLADKVEDVFTFLLTSICGSLILLWQSLSGMFRVASASNVVASAGSASKLRVLWIDLFSHVFRAIRSILNGFVAFFTACNRHRLSIYNHVQVLIRRLAGQTPPLHTPSPSPSRTPIGSRSGSTSPRGLARATRSSYARVTAVNISTRKSRPTSIEILNERISTKLQAQMI